MSDDVNYNSYLAIDQLLDIQKPLADNEHDEMLFIIIHQVYELWFKQIIHEMKPLKTGLSKGDTFKALATLRRILTILKTMVSQLDVLETMTPLSFSSFRDRLGTSSGFQSAQFRMFEFILGNKNPRMLEMHKSKSATYSALKNIFEDKTLYDHFFEYIEKRGKTLPQELKNRDVTAVHTPNKELQNTLVELYKNDPEFTLIAESLVDLDEGVQEWRYRHVKMIERTIGDSSGTGGSSGAEYLKKTLFKPAFKDLWDIRSLF